MIEVTGLGKRFGSLTAVHDLTFTVGDGEIFGILGPNGAGKTTSVRMLAGLIAPSQGTARINGNELGSESQRIRATTGILTESPGLHDRLTARQNLAYYGRLYGLRGRPLAQAVDRYLRVVGLSDAADRKVGGFSKGMRQKVAIARALLHEPEVIYLDEPTSGLDPSAAKTIRDFVATLRDAGRSIVVCTHNLDEAERLCDRIGIMRGTLLQVDTPARLRRGNGTAAVRVDLVGARRPSSFLDLLAGLPFVAGARADDGSLVVEVREPRGDNPELVRALVDAGARIVAVHEEAATLEQVYLDLVGEAGERDADAARIGEVA
ncbi:MAG TPA: ABC transporter ATP-binding protein [Candidatus Limnocylindrales bacterium]|jgi:ABC-2 type transport system ATP-binding protein|nr:ABC transporter ATP-binding protein [Candidatus Limnocylindrales bacterium]